MNEREAEGKDQYFNDPAKVKQHVQKEFSRYKQLMGRYNVGVLLGLSPLDTDLFVLCLTRYTLAKRGHGKEFSANQEITQEWAESLFLGFFIRRDLASASLNRDVVSALGLAIENAEQQYLGSYKAEENENVARRMRDIQRAANSISDAFVSNKKSSQLVKEIVEKAQEIKLTPLS